MKKLNKRARMMMLFIHEYKKQNDFSPNIREIGVATGCSSTSAVNYYLDRLEGMGWIGFLYLPAPRRHHRRERAARTVHLSEAGREEVEGWLKSGKITSTFPVQTGETVVSMPGGLFERRSSKREKAHQHVPEPSI
jgi:SOS-response transcriptional repressor LexA